MPLCGEDALKLSTDKPVTLLLLEELYFTANAHPEEEMFFAVMFST